MSDTAVTPTNETAPEGTNPDATTTAPEPGGMFLDGEAPRLGTAPIIPPAPMGGAGTQVASDGSGAASLPVVSPVLTAPDTPTQPTEERVATQAPAIPEADLPTLPTASAASTGKPLSTEDDNADEDGNADEAEPSHPMAHLMPPKSKPTEASIRAAEQRAVKKAKARKIKVGVAIGALVVAALAGPPLVSWLTNAINESGSLNTEEPAD